MKIHAAVVEGLSDPMYAMINNGQMMESVDQVAELDDVSPEIFAAFCEHAYTGKYTTPSLAVKKPAENASQSPTEASASAATPPQPPPSKKQKTGNSAPQDSAPPRPNQLRMWHMFCGLVPSNSSIVKAPVCVWPDLLFHARLSIFATRYLVHSLQEQTIASLHRDLKNWPLKDGTEWMIFNLLEFTYDNAGRQDPGVSLSLRKLVNHYIPCVAHFLRSYVRFRKIIDRNGEMGADMMEVFVE